MSMDALPSEIHDLSPQDKIDLMELLWDNIITSTDIDAEWHEELLQDRERIQHLYQNKDLSLQELKKKYE